MPSFSMSYKLKIKIFKDRGTLGKSGDQSPVKLAALLPGGHLTG
jgi:hypothetical protein